MDGEFIRRGPGRPRKVEEVSIAATGKIKLLRDYWAFGGDQIAAGSEVELPIEEARDVIAKGIAVRNDEF